MWQANNTAPDFEEEEAGSDSGVEEEAEAKLERLAAAAQAEKRTAATPAAGTAKKQAVGRKGKQRAAAGGDESAAAGDWGAGAAASWGVGSDAVEEALAGDVLQRVRAHQASLDGRSHLLSASNGVAEKGSRSARKAAGKVQIGTVSEERSNKEEGASAEAPETPEKAAAVAADRSKLSLEAAIVAAPAVEDSDEEGGSPQHDVGEPCLYYFSRIQQASDGLCRKRVSPVITSIAALSCC